MKKDEVRAKEFSKYLNEKLEQYKVSVAALAEELYISRKTLYRYKKAEVTPAKEIEQQIKLYFQRCEQKLKEEEGMRYASEHDLTDEELNFLFYEMAQDELEDELQAGLNTIITEQTGLLKKALGCFNRFTQKYILANFDIFCLLDKNAMELVGRVNKLEKNRYLDLVSYLERIPMDMGILTANQGERFPLINIILRIIQSDDELPANKYGQIPVDGKSEISKETYEAFHKEIEDLVYSGITIPTDILARIKTIVEYTFSDWYFLFLYERMRRADISKGFYRDLEMDGRFVGDLEYMFLNYLYVMERPR